MDEKIVVNRSARIITRKIEWSDIKQLMASLGISEPDGYSLHNVSLNFSDQYESISFHFICSHDDCFDEETDK